MWISGTLRKLSKRNQQLCRRFFGFITTPIFYVNSDPHIGHLYTACIADTLHRWDGLKGRSPGLFFAGTDEHGLKVQRAAQKAGLGPAQFCDKLSQRFTSLFAHFNVNPTHFIRTTEKKHHKAVDHFWRTLEKNGHIYQDAYGGWYSPSEEVFLAAWDVMEAPGKDAQLKVSKTSGQPVEWIEEKNYRFRLTSFVEEIRHWLTNSDVVRPETYLPEILSMLEKLEDISVSRESSRLSWGIPVPGDPSQTVYVWLDALVNYLTLAGYPDPMSRWPPDCQIIGKDIMKFHCVFWPAFLMAHGGVELPKRIFIHSHWLTGNLKMSKSRGNVVDPWEHAQLLTAEGLRYFLIRHQVPHSDTKYSLETASTIINDELYNCLGNLVSRSVVKNLNPSQSYLPCNRTKLDSLARSMELMEKLQVLPDQVDRALDDGDFYSAVDLIMSAARQTNGFFHKNGPWTLLKKGETEKAQTVLGLTYESIRIVSILLQPFIPLQSSTILDRLGIPLNERSFEFTRVLENCPGPERAGRPLGLDPSTPLFKRIQIPS